MRTAVIVHETREDFESWLRQRNVDPRGVYLQAEVLDELLIDYLDSLKDCRSGPSAGSTLLATEQDLCPRVRGP